MTWASCHEVKITEDRRGEVTSSETTLEIYWQYVQTWAQIEMKIEITKEIQTDNLCTNTK